MACLLRCSSDHQVLHRRRARRDSSTLKLEESDPHDAMGKPGRAREIGAAGLADIQVDGRRGGTGCWPTAEPVTNYILQLSKRPYSSLMHVTVIKRTASTHTATAALHPKLQVHAASAGEGAQRSRCCCKCLQHWGRDPATGSDVPVSRRCRRRRSRRRVLPALSTSPLPALTGTYHPVWRPSHGPTGVSNSWPWPFCAARPVSTAAAHALQVLAPAPAPRPRSSSRLMCRRTRPARAAASWPAACGCRAEQ